MSTYEARAFAGTVTDAADREIGEARMWGEGERGPEGGWTGWLRPGDLGGVPPPGRYRLTTFDGWTAGFEVAASRPSRVFETDLLRVVGIGPVPWPEGNSAGSRRTSTSPLVATPWQSSSGIPPFKQQGDGAPRAWEHRLGDANGRE